MGEARANSATTTMDNVVRELLDQLDSQAAEQDSAWAEKRDSIRRSFRTTCRIVCRSPDSKGILRTVGTTRDLSKGGLCFISRRHFMRKSPLGITVVMPNNEMKHLTGHVVYSRQAREGWYLTGVQFGVVNDVRLTVPIGPEQEAGEEKPDRPGAESAQAKPSGTAGEAPVSKRDEALSFLAALSASSMQSREMINRVVAVSTSPDAAVRHAAIPVLMQAPRRDAVMALLHMLRDPSVSVRIDAIEALGQLQAQEAIGALQKVLRHNNDEVALSAAEVLGSLGNQDGLRLVLKLLESDEAINRLAARALGAILGQRFSCNAEGVASARRYVKAKGIE